MEPLSRLRVLFRGVLSRSSPLHRSLRPFSSLPEAAESRSNRNFFSDDHDRGGSWSSVYQHALKFQRPSSIRWREEFHNNVSFIGTVEFPIREFNCMSGKVGVCTSLKVKTSESNHTFKILLEMWNEMAEICSNHLKPNDFIYVSGLLRSDSKDDEEENSRTYYKVLVKEINYVAQNIQGQSCQKPEQSGPEGETSLDRHKNRLHLWQVFFANPHEWYDKRKNKKNPKAPDFVHKGTGEALWLNDGDPPWIRKQLQLQDSRMAGGRVRSYSHLSQLVYDGI